MTMNAGQNGKIGRGKLPIRELTSDLKNSFPNLQYRRLDVFFFVVNENWLSPSNLPWSLSGYPSLGSSTEVLDS